MKITKIGHSCFIAEPKEGVRVMTDPGAYSPLAMEAKNISVVLITHEHSDHMHIETLKKVLDNNPEAVVITNTAVGKFLDEAGIQYTKVEEGQKYELRGVIISGFGNVHAEIYPTIGPFQNTGYMIDNLCHLGDSFNYPDANIEILALPMNASWMKIKDALDYVKNMNSRPRVIFAVHDAHIQDWAKFIWKKPGELLEEFGAEFKKLELGKEEEL
jgi:L-ascorbate metabolism protein UlaG (beta-lactamase superfamily)